jgi:hypothetical protein
VPTRQAGGPGRPPGTRRWAAPAAAAVAVLALGGGLFAWLGPNRDVPVITPNSSSGPATGASAGAAGSDSAETAGSSAGSGGGAGASAIGEGAFAVQVTRLNCPAARVSGAGAACPVRPECWGGLVVNAGDATARSIGCTRKHTWQTFAVLLMPDRLTDADQQRAADDPTIAAVCRDAVLTVSLDAAGRTLPADGWSADVLAPSQRDFDAGSRVLRCVGGQGLDALRTPVFG